MSKPLTIHYEPAADRLTINGIFYAGVFFRKLWLAKPGMRFEIVKNDGGMITLKDLPSEKLQAKQ
jgi:hypothetical protein